MTYPLRPIEWHRQKYPFWTHRLPGQLKGGRLPSKITAKQSSLACKSAHHELAPASLLSKYPGGRQLKNDNSHSNNPL